MAFDDANHRLFVAGGNGILSIIDTNTGGVIDSVEIVQKVDQIALDAVGGLVYCAGPNLMSVVDVRGEKAVRWGDFPTAANAKNVAVDPATRAVSTTFSDGKDSYAKSWMAPR